jgi:predicted permease
MGWRERCYRALLLCYPAEFRCEYASEMTQLFRDQMRERPSPLLWLEFIADVVTTASREHFQMLLTDLRYTVRTLRKSPVFAAAAVLTLGLGIGATTSIFSVVNAVMLRPLPYAEPERLVRIAEKNDKLGFTTFSASVLNYLSWREQARSFEQIGAIGGGGYTLTGRGDPEQLSGATITPSIMPLLGLQPVLGRGFQEGEDRPGSAPVALVGEAFWKSHFGADRSLLGKTITLDGVAYTVVGIAPAALSAQGGDVFTPLIINIAKEQRLNHVVTAMGRLKRGVSVQQAQAEMDTVFAGMARQYPEIKDWGIRLLTFYDWFVAKELRTALLILLGAVGFVLLIACANVANLLLSRAASRQKEIAVRTALGASRGRLARQLLTESLALSILGGGAGLGAAYWAVRGINAWVTPNVLPVPDVPVDSAVLLFAVTVTVATGLLFGMAPAWFAAKADLNTVLKQGGRSSTGGVRPLLRNALVAGELALATMLLIGAALLTRSLLQLRHVPLGFRPESLLTFQVSQPASKYGTAGKSWAFYKALVESLESLPGVKSAAVSSGIPFGGGSYTTTPVTTPGSSVQVPVDWRIVSPSYFRAMEIPLLRGRNFGEQDGGLTPGPTIVSQEAAERLWGGADPLGRILRFGNGKEFVVVGVAAGVRNASLNQSPAPAIYLPAVLRAWPVMDVVVRTSGKPEAAVAGVRQKLRELDPEMPMAVVRTMDQWLDLTAAQPRLNAVLLMIFSAVALLIAAIGIYGVLSYSVTQRTREIGLRMAIGAQPGGVLRWIVREGMVVALAGIAVGLAGAIGVSRLLESLLFGVTARDPATFAGVAVALAVVAGAACYVPARRASRVDPIVALREE